MLHPSTVRLPVCLQLGGPGLNALHTHGVGPATQPDYRDFMAGDVRHSQADISKAQLLMGCASLHRFCKGIAQAMPWYLAQKNG